jgi:site-specific DNA-methyltransferase (adenine-specific)
MTAPIVREEHIGGQRLILGDCREVMPLLGKVGAVVTDPPYEDDLHAAMGSLGALRKDGKDYPSILDGKLSFAGNGAIRDEAARLFQAASLGWIIAFAQVEGVAAWREALTKVGAKNDTCLAWVKPDSAPRFNGQGAARGFECAVTAWAGQGHKRWNAGGKRGVYVHCVNVGRVGAHPTEKPVALMMELLGDYTSAGHTILDPFMGSGTTLVACQRMGRHGIGIEIDPDYFDIACRRVDEAARQPDLLIDAPAPKPKTDDLYAKRLA